MNDIIDVRLDLAAPRSGAVAIEGCAGAYPSAGHRRKTEPP